MKKIPISSPRFSDPGWKGMHKLIQELHRSTIRKKVKTYYDEQRIWRFENGYGASAIRFKVEFDEKVVMESKNADTYWEMAVIAYDREDDEGKLCYTTSITNDVLFDLKPAKITKILKKIAALPKYVPEDK